MHTANNFFVVGKLYTNRIGTYEVLEIQSKGMRIRYDSGREDWISDLDIQRRIVENVQIESRRICPYTEKDSRNLDYFWTLGFLASRARIEAIVPPRSQRGFEDQYQELKGYRPTPGRDMYYLHDPGIDKWGTELRVSFVATDDELKRLDFGPDVVEVPGPGPNDWRINNNKFVWDLFRLGFRLGADQVRSAILVKIPVGYRKAFEGGART